MFLSSRKTIFFFFIMDYICVVVLKSYQLISISYQFIHHHHHHHRQFIMNAIKNVRIYPALNVRYQNISVQLLILLLEMFLSRILLDQLTLSQLESLI